MRTEKVGTRSVLFTYELPEWDLNLHLIIGKSRNYIIDTGLGSDSVIPIKDYLGKNHKPIIVINTHYHWDHVWGNNYFSNDIIISHTLCRKLIAEHWVEALDDYKSFIRGDVTQCLPNLVFDDCLYFADDKIRIFYTPGHTADCISVFDEVDGVLNAGDNIGDTVDDIVPSLDMDSSIYLKSLRDYKRLDVNACVSGHNVVLSKDVFGRIEDAVNGF